MMELPLEKKGRRDKATSYLEEYCNSVVLARTGLSRTEFIDTYTEFGGLSMTW